MEKEIELNDRQTPIKDLNLESYPQELQDDFWEFFTGVPLIQELTSKYRKRACDLPKDEDGKIIVDLEHPHILENMDYFRKTAIFFEEHGYYTDLKPNPNPNSEYYKWVKEEVRRCHEGMVRPSDGEWIPGDLYFYWNYTEIQLAEKQNGKSKKALRLYKMPKVWDGTYWYFHYLYQAREAGEHGCMLSSRSKGKSFSAAAMLAKRFKLGETPDNNKGCTCYITASEKKFLVAGDQTLDKFQHDIDFISQKTEWPGRELLVNRLNDMMWTAGYKDLVYGNVGTGNSVVGITSKNDVEKLRGTRAVLYVLEEAGTFKGLDSVWQNILPSVEEGKGDERNVFGQIVCFGTSGDEESDFQSLAKMMYHPRGYHIKALANIYDIKGKGGSEFSYFFPAYLNNANCYDKDGNSDITKSLLEILKDRIYTKTHSGNDLNALTKTIAENPIVPQEAILRAKGNFFPTAQINERINELQQHPDLLNEIVTGDLVQQSDGSVKYVMTSKEPIRVYPLPNDFNNLEGAIEFYQMPQKDKDGKVYSNRYIAGYDPIDDDAASSTLSLNSIFVLDLWTDEIVCEWTGRFAYADDCYERVRLIALFYNAMILAENNKKGYYSYFASRNCAETLLAEAPDYLKDRNLVQLGLYGNKAHPYSEKVYTPNGIKLWKDIQIGDKLFNSYGTTTIVTDIPFNNESNIYEITLKDGRKVKASENHLWKVIDYNNIEKVISTKQMLEKGIIRKRGKYLESKYYIPKNNGVEFEEKQLPLPPYFMGLMIGDGCFTASKFNNANFASSIIDLETYKKYVPFECKTVDDRHHFWRVPNIGKILLDLKLNDKKSHTKFIPDVYKYNSKQNRLELLQGLFDTDGHIECGGNSAYVTVSKQLCDDVVEILRSLGINCSIQIRYNKYGKYYKVLVYTDIQLFKLERKYSKQKLTKTRAFKTGIVDIKYIGKEMAKCVTVDSNDNCYLINDFIVTHNSKGYNATNPLNNLANQMIRTWLTKPRTIVVEKEDGTIEEISVTNLSKLRAMALLRELAQYNIDDNFDRIRALGAVMLYREQFNILYEGDVTKSQLNAYKKKNKLANDKFFTRNYDNRFSKFSKKLENI